MTAALLAAESIARAERHADPTWLAIARRAVTHCASLGTPFSTDEIHAYLAGYCITTHDSRALGAVMRWAVNEGLCERTGEYRKSRREACHARPVAVYRGSFQNRAAPPQSPAPHQDGNTGTTGGQS
jgi:hypothetical protein